VATTPSLPSDRPATDVAPVAADAHLLTEVVTRLRRALRSSIRTDIPWESLPMAQVELLLTLEELAPARISDLAERLHLAGSTVSGLVGQMMSSGLVRRQTNRADRRAAVVTLTPAGRARLVEWEQAHEARIGSAFERLAATDRAAINLALPALRRLTEFLNEPRPAGGEAAAEDPGARVGPPPGDTR
jgi:DNA-binding MarR family transcriptional regulator